MKGSFQGGLARSLAICDSAPLNTRIFQRYNQPALHLPSDLPPAAAAAAAQIAAAAEQLGR